MYLPMYFSVCPLLTLKLSFSQWRKIIRDDELAFLVKQSLNVWLKKIERSKIIRCYCSKSLISSNQYIPMKITLLIHLFSSLFTTNNVDVFSCTIFIVFSLYWCFSYQFSRLELCDEWRFFFWWKIDSWFVFKHFNFFSLNSNFYL